MSFPKFLETNRCVSTVVSSFAFALIFLAGCGQPVNFPAVEAGEGGNATASDAGSLTGKLHGGQQPVVGAKIYLLAAGTTGYGSAATSLLTKTSIAGYPTQTDANGRYYVTTDSSGSFQIADSCTAGQQVYVASVGGNPGGGTNTAANEIAILGQCPQAGNFDSTLTGVIVSEISTVAAAYAASAYAIDTFDIGGPSTTTLEKTGIANAFANAANLFDVQNANDLARTVTSGGNGSVPRTKIHTIANILASCINSTGPSSTACSTLLSKAKTGGTSGTAPTDITTAAINIAHNPWANVSTLFALQTSIAPFSPQLSSTPNDLALSLDFSGAALANNPSLAIDGNGNVWTVSQGGSAVTKLSPAGKLMSGASGYSLQAPANALGSFGLAFDTSNNLWVLGESYYGLPTFTELNNSGVYQQQLSESYYATTTHPPTQVTNLALDGLGYFYYSGNPNGTSANCCTMQYSLSSGGFSGLDSGNATPGTNFVAVSANAKWATGDGTSVSLVATSNKAVAGGGLNGAVGVALDSSGYAWVVNSGNNSISKFNSSGTAISGTTGYTGGLATPMAIAVDGLGNIWVTNSSGGYNLSEFSSAGLVIGSSYSDSSLSNAGALAIDASGNLWIASSTSTTLTEFLGIAAPVVTPMASAASAGTLGTRP